MVAKRRLGQEAATPSRGSAGSPVILIESTVADIAVEQNFSIAVFWKTSLLQDPAHGLNRDVAASQRG
jgi:hypothetical protein